MPWSNFRNPRSTKFFPISGRIRFTIALLPRTLDTMRTRIPLLYLILAVLLVISVVPVWWFGQEVVGISRDKLKTNEMLLQNTITRSLGEDLGQRLKNLRLMISSLSTG